jgi:hypothetical protein
MVSEIHDNEQLRIYCTQQDLLVSLWQAFLLGRGSPYELKAQEADRLLKELKERSERHFKPNGLKKYTRNAESDDMDAWIDLFGRGM